MFDVHRPGKFEIIDEVYKDAREAGRHGVDCLKLYAGCPMGHGILDSVTFSSGNNIFNRILSMF
jgi:hypothetical protein